MRNHMPINNGPFCHRYIGPLPSSLRYRWNPEMISSPTYPPLLRGDPGESSCPWAINDIIYTSSEPHFCGRCPASWDSHHHDHFYSEKCSGFCTCGLKKSLEQKRETKSHMMDQIIICHIHFLTSCILTLLHCTAYPYGFLPPKGWNLDSFSIRLQLCQWLCQSNWKQQKFMHQSHMGKKVCTTTTYKKKRAT